MFCDFSFGRSVYNTNGYNISFLRRRSQNPKPQNPTEHVSRLFGGWGNQSDIENEAVMIPGVSTLALPYSRCAFIIQTAGAWILEIEGGHGQIPHDSLTQER